MFESFTFLGTMVGLFVTFVTLLIMGLAFGLGVAIASRILPVLTLKHTTYDNLDKK